MPATTSRTYPSVIVLESPKTALPAKAKKYRCMICMNFFKISDNSWQTVHQLRADHRAYIVCCHNCFEELRPVLPAEMLLGQVHATPSEARQIWGYQ